MIGGMTEQNVTQGTPVGRVNDAWDRIEAKLPADALGAPATESELDELEKALGLTLPEDVRASWLRHRSVDGEEPWDGGWIASPEQILRDYRVWTEMEANGDFDGFVEDAGTSADSEGKWYHEAWIPLIHDFGGNHVCLDTRTGRYVDMDHETGSSFLDYTDWAGFLEHTAGLLETKGLPSSF
ncbi:glucan synthase [Corynebacterium xerosis]|uniref:Glucan synthase n=2 Tax=Corynebacterium xerosis TaxID=1725 RepID=A0A6B8TNR4_9CORY|nr:glucan synthase [Corynebacterium xerosis]